MTLFEQYITVIQAVFLTPIPWGALLTFILIYFIEKNSDENCNQEMDEGLSY